MKVPLTCQCVPLIMDTFPTLIDSLERTDEAIKKVAKMCRNMI